MVTKVCKYRWCILLWQLIGIFSVLYISSNNDQDQSIEDSEQPVSSDVNLRKRVRNSANKVNNVIPGKSPCVTVQYFCAITHRSGKKFHEWIIVYRAWSNSAILQDKRILALSAWTPGGTLNVYPHSARMSWNWKIPDYILEKVFWVWKKRNTKSLLKYKKYSLETTTRNTTTKGSV